MGKYISPLFGRFRKYALIFAAVVAIFGGVLAIQTARSEDVYACDPLTGEGCDNDENSDNDCNPLTGENCGEPQCNPLTGEGCEPQCNPLTGENCDTGGGIDATPDTCYDAMGSLSWILCPATELLADVSDSLMDIIKSFLKTEPLLNNETSAIFIIWRVIRDFANIIFIILFLLVIYSQLTGRMMDNYNIKKTLPRLIVVAILINLSYYICAILVDVTNILGAQLGGLFESAKNTAETAIVASGGEVYSPSWGEAVRAIVGIGGPAILVGAVAAAVAFAPAGLVYMALMLVLGAVVALLAAFLVLAVRQALIVVLVAVSPIAFALYLMPNTEGIFKKWQRLFMQMLLLFPIFAALFGGAMLAGWAIMATAQNIVSIMLGLAVQAIPLIVTPFLLKNTGTMLDKVNSGFRKVTEPLTGRAQGYLAEKQQIAKTAAIAGTAGGVLGAGNRRIAQFLEKHKAMRAEHLRQGASNIDSMNRKYISDEQLKTKRVWNNGMWVDGPGKEMDRLNESKILAYEADVAALDVNDVLASSGRRFLYATDSKGNKMGLTTDKSKAKAGEKAWIGDHANSTLRKQVELQEAKGKAWFYENDLLISKWNNDRQDTEDIYYDMWELVNSRHGGKRHKEWLDRSKILSGNRGEPGMEFAVAYANAKKSQVDKEANDLAMKIIPKTQQNTWEMKQFFTGYKINDEGKFELDGSGNKIKYDEKWIDLKDVAGNTKFRLNIEDKPVASALLDKYMSIGDCDLNDLFAETRVGGRLNHVKADIFKYAQQYKLKENLFGYSPWLGTIVANADIANDRVEAIAHMISANMTGKTRDYVAQDKGSFKQLAAMLQFGDSKFLALNPGKYSPTLDDLKLVKEVHGHRQYRNDATAVSEYKDEVMKLAINVVQAWNDGNASQMDLAGAKPEAIEARKKLYKTVAEEFERITGASESRFDRSTKKFQLNIGGNWVDAFKGNESMAVNTYYDPEWWKHI